LPYASIDDLPPSVRAHLPPHAREIYLAAFNSAWAQYDSRDPSQRERTAHRVAWAAVKHGYRKAGDRRIAREAGGPL
jgi:cation transport regulator